MKKTTILVMFVTVIAKVFGFLRESFIVKFFPDRGITDAFQIAYTIPNAILAVIAAALVAGLVPMISKISEEDGEESADRFTSNILNIFSVVCIILNIFVLIFPEFFISLFASWESTSGAMVYASAFVRVISFGMVSIAVIQLGMGYLNIKRSFLIPAGISIPANIFILFMMFISAKINQPMLLAYGQLVALLIQALVIYLYMKRNGFKHSFKIDFKDEHLKIMLGLALPLVIGSFIGQLNDILMKREATAIYAKAGAYTFMNNATKLAGFVSGIVITSIMSVTYPTIARNVVKGNVKEVRKSINDSILMLLVLVLPAVAGFTVLGEGIVSLAYGGLTPTEVATVVPIFIFTSFNLIGVSIRELFTRVQYAYSDMKSSVFVLTGMSIAFVLTMRFFVGLTSQYGQPLAGIALTYSVYSILGVIPMYFAAKKHVGKIPLGIIKKDLIKIFISTLLMGASIILLKGTLMAFLGLKLGTVVLISVGGIVYLASLIALRTQFVLRVIYSVISKH